MSRLFISALALFASLLSAQEVQTLASGDDYLAFPTLIELGDEVLVSYKRGKSHAADAGARQELLRLERATGKVLSTGTLAEVKGEIMQMGEWVRFANGDVANYIDAQEAQGSLRTGLAVVRSNNGGTTFGPVQRLGVVDGMEYGYAFDSITRGSTTWMLVMTFANLTGGKLVFKTKSQPGSVDVIRSDDNGLTWRFVRRITAELGHAPINESAFMPHGDGFIVTARGYDNRQWLLRTDVAFKVLQKVDLNAAHDFITSHIGRPRLFQRDVSCYLLGRNWAAPGLMQLALFKFDPQTLDITRYVILDNAEKKPVADGYYAQPYWTERDGHTRFHVITYKRGSEKNASIVKQEMDWAAVK
ncbi:MAG: sialidase family protein [Verrucomicrobiaceae bacterium]